MGYEQWLEALTQREYETYKLVLDKGALALLLAAVGALIAVLLERYKSIFSGRNEAMRDERQHQLQLLRDELESARALQKDERESARAAEQEEREKVEEAARKDRERSLVPRTQLDIECRFFGLQHGKIIVTVHLVAENRGKTIRGFKSMRYRVFTMTGEDVPELYASRDGMSRLALRGPSVDESTKEGYIFSVEPGIRQIFPFTTLVPADTKYVSVKVDV